MRLEKIRKSEGHHNEADDDYNKVWGKWRSF